MRILEQKLAIATICVSLIMGPLYGETVEPMPTPTVPAAEAPAAEAVPAPVAPAAEPSIVEISKPTAEGVIPSIVLKGDIVDFLRMLSVTANRNIVPSRQVKGQVVVNLFDVTIKEALDAILPANGFAYEEKGVFIFVYTQQEFAQLVAAARKTESRVFNLNYIPTTDAEALIAPLMSQAGLVKSSPAVGDAQELTGDKWAGSNYMVVVDYPENIEVIAELISKIDTRPPQVLIEATILVASLDETNELGIDFNVLSGVNFSASGGGVGTIPTGEVAISGTETSAWTQFNTNLTGGGLSVGIVKNNIGLFIEALESITDVVTIGNPKVLTLNRQSGSVIVGNRDGYITTEVSQTTATQTVEFLETGTQLDFRPFVMEDGYVRMELKTEESDGGVEVQGNFTLPSETTAAVTSNILVQDGHTIVIGGLFREKTTLTKSQIPLLGDIPGLGALFRSNSDKNQKEEVIFLVTPHIVKEEIDYAIAEEILDNTDRIMASARGAMQWHSREQLSSYHYKQAHEKLLDGDLDSAIWYADMAVNINPLYLDAIKLRDDLRARGQYDGEVGSMRNFMRRLLEKDSVDRSALPGAG